MKCGECGSSEVSSQNVKGRCFPHRQWHVVISVDLSLNVCSNCTEVVYLSADDCKRLDKACRESLMKAELSFDTFLRKKGLDI